jgi:hypothetical protein
MAGELEQYDQQRARARYIPRAQYSRRAHRLKMIGLAAPFVIGEFVTDVDKGWKWTRFAILLTAMARRGSVEGGSTV